MTNSDPTNGYPPWPTRTERIENIRRGDIVAGIGIVTQDAFVNVDRRVSVVTERETLTGRLGETLQLEASIATPVSSDESTPNRGDGS